MLVGVLYLQVWSALAIANFMLWALLVKLFCSSDQKPLQDLFFIESNEIYFRVSEPWQRRDTSGFTDWCRPWWWCCLTWPSDAHHTWLQLFKYKNSLLPEEFLDLLTLSKDVSTHTTRSLDILCINLTRFETINSSPFYLGMTLCNTLQTGLRNAQTLAEAEMKSEIEKSYKTEGISSPTRLHYHYWVWYLLGHYWHSAISCILMPLSH